MVWQTQQKDAAFMQTGKAEDERKNARKRLERQRERERKRKRNSLLVVD